jgi:hypothetical protein
MFRTAITRQARLFGTSTRLQKTPIEMGKDALKKVDRVVSDAAVKGIETGGMYSSTVFVTRVFYTTSSCTHHIHRATR